MCHEAHRLSGGSLHGGVGCGRCWEQAIRADERFVGEFGLDHEPAPEVYVDEIAVEKACRGDRVSLTDAERDAVIQRLHTKALTVNAITRRVGLDASTVHATLDRLAAEHANREPEAAA